MLDRTLLFKPNHTVTSDARPWSTQKCRMALPSSTKKNTRTPIFCIWDETSHNGGFAQQVLLINLPFVGMAQDIVCRCFYTLPERGSICMRLFDKMPRTLVKILEKVCEDLNGGLASRQRRDLASCHSHRWFQYRVKMRHEPGETSVALSQPGNNLPFRFCPTILLC